MAVTESERRMKNTLQRMVVNNEIQYYHRENSPQYHTEKIDFYVIDNIGRSHLIEVKSTGASTSISPSQFKPLQKEVLTSPVLNDSDAHTRCWVYCHIYHGDTTKRSKDHFDVNYIVPGHWIGEKTLNKSAYTKKGTYQLGIYENREWNLAGKGYGRSTRGNEKFGFKTLGGILGGK